MNLKEALEEINSRLNESRLTLDFDDASDLMMQLRPLLFTVGTPFVMEGCQIAARPADEPEELILTGKAALNERRSQTALGQPMTVALRLTAEGEALHYHLSASAAGRFTMEGFFGELDRQYRGEDGGMEFRNSLISGLILENPVAETQTEWWDETCPFRLRGALYRSEEWGSYGYLWGGSPLPVQGQFALFSRFGRALPFVLEAGLSWEPKAAFLKETRLNSDFLQSGKAAIILQNEAPNSQEIFDWGRSTTELSVTFHFRGMNTGVTLRTPLFLGDGYWPFQMEFDQGLSLGDVLGFFLSLFGMDGGRGNLLLPPEAGINHLRLFGLQLGMGHDGNLLNLQSVTALLRTASPWKLPLPGLTIENLGLRWCMQWGRNGNMDLLTGQIAGDVRLELFGGKSLRLFAEADLPGLTIRASLSLEQKENGYNLADVIGQEASFCLPGKAGGGFLLATVELEASYLQRSLSIYAEVNDVLSFSLGNLSVRLEKLYGKADFSQTGNLYGFGGEASFGGSDGFRLGLYGAYQAGIWDFDGGLVWGKLSINKLISSFLTGDDARVVTDFPDFEITRLNFHYHYDSPKKESGFSLSTALSVDWGTILGFPVNTGASLLLENDKQGINYISVMLQLNISPLAIAVQADNFHTANPVYHFLLKYGDSALRASYAVKNIEGRDHQIISIRFEHVRLGDLLAWLVSLVNPNAGASLPSPWDVILGLDLSRFFLEVDMTDETARFEYRLHLGIPGLFTVEGVGAEYGYGEKGGGLKLLVDAGEETLSWDPIRESPPNVAEDPKRFHLAYLGLGQHFTTDEVQAADSVKKAVEALKATFRPEEEGSRVRFDSRSNWVFGADFTVNEALHISLVLNDPTFYGVLIEVDSDNAPFAFFKGLSLELLYQKVTKDIGMFRATLLVPESMRRLDFGGIVVYLGTCSIEIYTNGNFLLDLGFPAGRDFTRSFGLQYGIFAGKGGLLFGLLCGATCPKLPSPVSGAFTSVLELGVGISVSVGQQFDFGIVAGGLSLTLVGIFEGLFAIYDPGEDEDKSLYYRVSATLGIVGRVFVKVNLYIISLEASAELSAFAQLTLEAYRAAHVQLDVRLTLAATVRIVFFKIKLHFDFSHEFQFTMGSDSTAPWERKRLRDAAFAEVFIPVAMPEGIDEAEMTASVLLSAADGEYCAAFVPVLKPEAYRKLVDLLARFLLFPFGDYPGRELLEALTEEALKAKVDYDCLSTLLQLNFHIRLTSVPADAAADGEMEGYAFPMPPSVELTFEEEQTKAGNDSHTAQARYRCAYWEEYLVPADYAETLQIYFETFCTIPDAAFPAKRDGAGQSLAQAVFVDILHMLLKGLMNQAKAMYQRAELGKEELDFTKLHEAFGITAKEALGNNPELPLAALSLVIPERRLLAGGGETIAMAAARIGCDEESLYEDNARIPSLLMQSAEITLEDGTFSNPTGLTPDMAAALFFIRRGGYDDESGYHTYVETLYPQVDGGMNWTAGEGKEPALHLPVGLEWSCLPGDTLEGLARLCAVLDGKLDDRAGWIGYRDRFLALNRGWTDGPIKIPGQKTSVNGDIHLSGLCLRLFAEDNASCREILRGQPLLRQNAALSVLNTSLEIPAGTTVRQALSESGLSVEELAAALSTRSWPFEPYARVVLEGAETVPKAVLLKRLRDTENADALAAAGSRFLLQGLRVPQANHIEQTTGLFEALGQQIPFDAAGSGWRLTLDGGDRASWLTGAFTQTISPKQAAGLLPDRDWDWRSTVKLAGELPLFTEIRRAYPLGAGLCWARTGENGACETQWAIHPFPTALKEAVPDVEAPGLFWREERLEVKGFGLLIPVGVRSENGILSVEGAGPQDRLLLEARLAEGAADYVLLSKPPVTDGLPGLLVEIPASGNAMLIQTNLSRETHMFPQNRMGRETGHTARYGTQDFLRLLWQCSAVGGGGYYLCLDEPLDESCFDADQRADLWLFAWTETARTANCAVLYECLPAVRGELVFLREEGELPAEPFIGTQPTLPPGNYGVRLIGPMEEDGHMDGDAGEGSPADTTHSLMSIIGYQIGGPDYGKMAGRDSRPLLPREENNSRIYDAVIPFYRAMGENPYLVLGKRAELTLYCRDVLGNAAPQVQTVSIMPTINDFMMGIHEWPGVSLSWALNRPEGKDGALVLSLYADCQEASGAGILDPEAGLGAGENAGGDDRAAAGRLQRGLWQLEQAGQLIISAPELLKDASLTAADKASLLEYGIRLHRYLLSKRAEEGPGTLRLDIPVSAECTKKPFYPLSIRLTIKRPGQNELPEEALQAESVVEPRIQSDNPGALESFARDFERVVPGSKLAKSSETETSLYVVRTGGDGMIPSVKIRPYEKLYEGIQAPAFYAYHPLSTSPVSRRVLVPQYDGQWEPAGEDKEQSFPDCDVDVMMAQVFEDVERCLDSRFARTLSTFAQNDTEALIAAKETLAKEMADTLIPIALNGAGAGLSWARQLAADRLKKNLVRGSKLAAVAEYPAEMKDTGVRLTVVAGQGPENGDGLLIQAAKLDTARPALFLLVEFDDPCRAGGELNPSISFQDIEYDVQEREGGYESSRWLRLICPIEAGDASRILDADLSSGLLVPNPLRRLPKPLRLDGQLSRPGTGPLYQWEHVVQCTGWAVEQDEHTLNLCYEEAKSLADADSEDLIWSLCRYTALRNRMMTGILEEEDAAAFAVFTGLVQSVAEKWPAGRSIRQAPSGRVMTCTAHYRISEKQMVLSGSTGPWEARIETEETGEDGAVAFRLLVDGLSLYKENQAIVRGFTTRNQSLFKRAGKAAGTLPIVDELFIYRTQPLSLPALYASAAVDGMVRLGEVAGKLNQDTAKEALALLGRSLGLEGIGNPAQLTVWAAYAMGEVPTAVRLPIALFPALTASEISGSEEIAGRICGWFEANTPGWSAFSLIFGIRIYAPSGFRTLLLAERLEVSFSVHPL